MEPSQVFLRSLKVIKVGNKRHESSHCNIMEALATTTKNSLEKPDGRRLKENGRGEPASETVSSDSRGVTTADSSTPVLSI